jgi:hypothetical protein
VHQKVYVPGWLNVQPPLQLGPDAEELVPTGTVLAQLGVPGPLRHSTPCETVVGLLKVTDPPGATERSAGDHE